MSLGKFSIIIGLVVTICGIVWYAAIHDAEAKDQAKEQSTLVEVVQTLTAIHVRQSTIEEAEQALTARLCAQSKLKGADCESINR